jgi:hypothetical protein
LRVKRALSVSVLVAAGACSDHPAPKKDTPAPVVILVPTDAGVAQVELPPGVDPSAVHIDDYGTPSRPPSAPAPIQRERRAIDVTLRSSPPGAAVSVDGTPIGTTPAFWSGYADGHEHQFVFTLPRHAIARYRFVPVSSGVIHARLDPIAEERDAGVAPPPELVPQPPPSAVIPPAPPPTIVTPDAPIPDAVPVAPVVEPAAVGPLP